jgi:putative hydrolase of the HAD superfamily
MTARAVLFDLGNTLVSYYAAADFPPILRACLRACVGVLPIDTPIDAGDLEQRALSLNVERPDLSVWPLNERLRILFGDAASEPEALQRLAAAFMGPIFATAIVDPDALAVLGALRARGIRTAIVSNTPWGSSASDWRSELRRHGLLAAVDAAVFCVEVGFRKPHPAPIERALSLVGVPAADALFVGDDPRWDVLGAQRAGVRAALLSKSPAPGVSTVGGLREVLEEI